MGPSTGPTAIQARGSHSWHHTLENAVACLKISPEGNTEGPGTASSEPHLPS